MRPWTIAAASCGALLALLGLTIASDDSPAPATAALAPPPDTVYPLRLVRGDTMRVRLRVAAPTVVTIAGKADSVAWFRSSDTTVARVDDLGLIRTVASGTAVISGIARADSAISATLSLEVVDSLQATNDMVVEVCPNDDERRVREQKPVPAVVAPIHEFHDCQRLIYEGRNGENAYGPVAGIFANGEVAKLQRWQDFAGGRLAAVVMNFVVKGQALTYAPLGLEPGTSCLMLKANSETRWEAALIPQRTPVITADTGRVYARTCDRALTWEDVPRRTRVPLQVKLQKGVDMDDDSIAPPVARWDWDPRHRVNYMGVKCGATTWCEIGPPDFTPSTPITIFVWQWPLLQLPWRRDSVIKGYYDEQFLASAAGSAPSSIFGTIRPGDDAHPGQQMEPAMPKWYEVADIDFRQTKPGEHTDYLHYVKSYIDADAAEPPGNPKASTTLRLKPKVGGTTDELYEGRFNGKPLGEKGIRSRVHKHLEHVPPIVRWRWNEKDESTWSYCKPDGCCENVKVLN